MINFRVRPQNYHFKFRDHDYCFYENVMISIMSRRNTKLRDNITNWYYYHSRIEWSLFSMAQDKNEFEVWIQVKL